MAKRTSGARAYAGILAEPIYEPIVSGLLGPEFLEEVAKKQAMKRRNEKLPALLKHYNIDPAGEHHWLLLCYELACKHVPGFRIHYADPPRPGRNKTWQAGLGDELVTAIEGIRTGRQITIQGHLEK